MVISEKLKSEFTNINLKIKHGNLGTRFDKYFVIIFCEPTKTSDFQTGAVFITIQQMTFKKVLPI